jgi:hypothetical protein
MMKLLIFLSLALAAHAACPDACSGHGTCGLSSKCTCQARWVGTNCASRECPYGLSWTAGTNNDNSPAGTVANTANTLGGRHAYTECSSRGVCDRDSGECACFEGYAGRGCRRTSCPNDCSGHGRCRYNNEIDTSYAGFANARVEFSAVWDAAKTRQCQCDRGWEGIDCASRICPKGDDPLTDCNGTPGVSEDESQIIMFPNNAGFGADKFFTLTFTDMFNGVLVTRPIATNHAIAATTATANCVKNVAKCFAAKTQAKCTATSGGTSATIAGTWTNGACRGANDATSQCAGADVSTNSAACVALGGCVYAAADSLCQAANGHLATLHTDTCGLVQGGDVAAGCTTTTYTYDSVAASVGFKYTALAADVKSALEELPNFAIPSVTVTAFPAENGATTNGVWAGYTDKTGTLTEATCTAAGTCFHTIKVQFTDAANAGKQNLLAVNAPLSGGHNTANMQPRFLSYTGTQATVRSAPLTAAANQHKEHVECSNRGSCDASSGTCACHEGFTGEACQKQTVFF